VVSKEEKLSGFFESINEVETLLKNKEVFIFLDYDGTLTPIVDTPDLAVLSNEMHVSVKELSQKYKVSIVSGRATADVSAKVGIENLYYAGSHGFEILQPDGHLVTNQKANEIRSTIDNIYTELFEKLRIINGALVEHVKYTVSVHYRLVSKDDYSKVEEVVSKILQDNTNLKKTDGKKVFEIRPNIDWHKGKAVEFIMEALEFNSENNAVVYIGDDTTDEDAFKAIKGKGLGVLVAEKQKETDAQFIVKDTDMVKEVLQYFITRKQ